MNGSSRMSEESPVRAAPLISVVMPCHNGAQYLLAAAESALAQSHRNVELIIVDDGSTDLSGAIISELQQAHPDRVRALRTNRMGPYPARNAALRHVRGDYVAFLDADDWWVPDALAKLCSALVEYDADIAYCGWQNVGEDIRSAPYVPPAYEDEDPVAHFVRTCPWPIHAALLKRNVLERLGGFSERCYSSMDYDFWLRALAVTRRIKRVPEVLAFYRWHGSGQISAVRWRQVLDALDAQRSFIRDNPELVAHLAADRLRELTEGQVLKQAYRAFWKRDLASAQKLFRHAASARCFRWRDLPHLGCALLPMPLYRGMVGLADRIHA